MRSDAIYLLIVHEYRKIANCCVYFIDKNCADSLKLSALLFLKGDKFGMLEQRFDVIEDASDFKSVKYAVIKGEKCVHH